MTQTRAVATPFGVFIGFDRDLITRQMVRYGVHAGGELAMLLSALRPGDRVIDVGAHIGTFAIPMAREVGVNGRVVCFEPFADSLHLLNMNVELNGLTEVVVTRGWAVSDRSGRWSPVMPEPENTGATYLTDRNGPDGVDSLSLDEWLAGFPSVRPVDLLKIDTEGMELLVLNGAKTTISEDQPLIYAEVAPEQLDRFGATVEEIELFLRSLGYAFYRNIGERHGHEGHYVVGELDSFESDELFDLLAVPPRRATRLQRLKGLE